MENKTIAINPNENQNSENGVIKKKSFMTKLLDATDSIDRKLYGHRLSIFIITSITVVLIAPIIDWLINSDKITFWLTFLFFIFLLILFLAWIGSWRDDNGAWTWKRAKFRLKIYFQTLAELRHKVTKKSKIDHLYSFGLFLFFSGFCLKALQNVSTLIRKPIASITPFKLKLLKSFESWTNLSYIFIVIGLIILIYIYNKYPGVINLKKIFRKSSKSMNDLKIQHIIDNNETVLHSANDKHIMKVTNNCNVELFNQFLKAIQEWKPQQCYYEYEYQDLLYQHLSLNIPDSTVEWERPIGSKIDGTNGRADLVLNNCILIEMKKSIYAGEIQRAKGQVAQYSNVWKENGPVILVLCNVDYNQARTVFSPFFEEQLKLKKNVLAIVVN